MNPAGSLDDLHAYVAKRVRLSRKGRGWVGLCPFHKEKTPSFGIYVGKRGEGRFHCMGCGADGDLGDWLKDVERVEPEHARKIRPPMPDIREPPPKVAFLGEDPAAWARHDFPEYDRYLRRHLPGELAEVTRIHELRRLIEEERNSLSDRDTAPNDVRPIPDAYRDWLRSERAAAETEPES